MAIQAKSYANKAGKAEGKDNRIQISMGVDEAKSLAKGDKALLDELKAAVAGAVKK